MYLEDTIVEEANSNGASWFLDQTGFNAPNVNNIEEFPHYKNIYEHDLELEDRTVRALVYEPVDDPRRHSVFIYDDLMVLIVAEPDRINDEWFSHFSLKLFEP